MRIIFMGSPEFAVPSLDALVEAGHDVVAVYSQPPRPAGRGKGERKTAVHERAEQLGIEVRTPRTLRDAEEQARFRALDADLAVVAAYGLILPKPILEAPKARLHQRPRLAPAALARRGADPARDPCGGRDQRRHASCRWMKGWTPGRCCCGESSIFAGRTPGKSRKKWRNSAREALVEWLGRPTPAEPQPIEGATYAAKIDKAETRIDWAQAGERDRAAGARLRSDARRLVRGQWRADQAARGRDRTRAGPAKPGEVLDER